MNSKKEKLLNDTYYKWIQTSLYDLPLSGTNDFVDAKIMGYGSAIDEKVLSISGYCELINRQREQAVGLEMSFEITPVFRSISNKEDSAIFVDEIKVLIIVNEDKQELFLRITTILEYIDSKWIVVHWHGSMPTETTAETDVWLVNEWKRKNAELEKLVSEKTIELLNKNRELEIEASLEKVRAVAMGMREPTDMLDVCKTISLQLQSLGVKEIRNVQTAIFYEQRGTYMNYEFYAKHDKTFITETTYTNHEIHNAFATKMLRGKGETFITHIKGDEVKDWIEYQRTTNVFIDKYLETASSLNYYWFSLGPVALGISTYIPLAEDEINLFKRFLKVFELAYQRYLDIEKAIAQAREARIEASLEKVRAAAMSMNKPDDLLNICEVLFKEFLKLGFGDLRNAMINIHNDEKGTFVNYDYSDEIGRSINHLTYNIHPVIEKQIKQIRSANDAFSETFFTGKDLEEWQKFRNKIGEKDDPRIDEISALYYYFYSTGTGSIGISTFSSINVEKLELLKRFRNVFSLSYQRYLDIALAEAQAREAKIEAALERVRSRTMGMQKSEELKDVIQVVYEQFVHLNIGVEHTGFIMDYKERYDMHIWLADPNKVPFQITIPYFDSPHWNSFIEAKDKGLDFFANHLSFEEKNKFYQDLFKLFHVPDKAKEYYFSCPGLAISTVLLENVGLYIENFSGTPYSDEENATLMRFGKVFQQTYTRFLDLQKAEAQAREAQIEAALERIRSAAMAMRDSSELSELIYKLYGELTKLDAKLDRCFIMIVNSENRGITWWLAGKEGLLAENGFFIQMNQHPSHLMYLECWEKRKKKWQYLFEGKEKRDWDSFGFSNTELARLPEFIKKDMAGVKKIHLSGSSDQFGSLVTGSLEPLPEEQQDIISRFTIAFNQAFIRFLDLEKAEAQTREAQIEAALERVRATSLAMHHTSELQGVVDSLSRQFQNLDIDANGGAFITINKEVEKDLPIWGSSGAANYIQKVTIPFLDKPIFTQLRDAIKNRNDFLVEEYTHTEKIEFFQHLFNHSPWNLLPPKRKKELLSREGGYIRSLTVSRYTSIFIINHNGKKFSESDNDILKRFGKVFEQSYTRFLDLQKAEAQNKIIQADNERKTKELEEARQLQLSLLPKELPKLPNLDIAVYVKTATEVGGDYYDFNVDDDGTLTAVIGDATGHGMKAGTIVSMIKALFASGGSHLDIKTFFNQSSAALKGIELGRLMMAFIMLKIKANKLVFANAGMPSLFIYRNKTREVEETMLHGMPLGAMKNFPYEIKETEISSGDTILLLSDGLPELKNEKNEQYDYERVKEEFNLAADKSPNDIVEYMKSSASKWSNGIESDDDVTFVVIKVK